VNSEQFNNLFQNAVTEKERAGSRPHSKYHYATEAFIRVDKDTIIGKCPRKTIYGINDNIPKDDLDASTFLKFACGNVMEDVIMDFIRSSEYFKKNDLGFLSRNVKDLHEWGVSIEADALTLNMGLELKTHNDRQTTFLKEAPKPDHVMQSAIYSSHWKKPWLIMYTNTNTFKAYQKNLMGCPFIIHRVDVKGNDIFVNGQPYAIALDEKTANPRTIQLKMSMIKEGFNELTQHKQERTLPDKTKSTWNHCNYCQFKGHCGGY